MRRLLPFVAMLLASLVIGASGAAASQPASATQNHAAACKSGYYKNVSGRCIHRPVRAAKAPAGATAKCRDGTYSFSQHARGTCSGHGGVAIWIRHP